MKLLSIAGHVLSFFPFLTHQNLMYQFFLIFFLKQICVIVTPTPYGIVYSYPRRLGIEVADGIPHRFGIVVQIQM
jgi:hypothetical protein